MDKVAVVILNYNGKEMLQTFLRSVIKYSSSASIIVADNCSTDDSISFLKQNHPSIQLISLDKNYGYSHGYNIALQQVKAEYYILLNSDVEVTPNWIEPILAIMDKDPSIAACQPKIKSYKEKDFFEYAGAGGGFIDFLGYPFCQGRIFSEVEKDIHQYDQSKEIFWASGACFFIRASLFHEFQGFDPDFFAHMEEIDLCWRLKSAEYKIMYCHESTIYHVGGGTLSQEHPKKLYLNIRNSLWMLGKNLPTIQLIYKVPFRLVLDGVFAMQQSAKSVFKIITLLLKGKLKNGYTLFKEMWIINWYIFKAHIYFYLTIPKITSKRKKIRFKRIDFKEVYKKSIVFSFFIRFKKKFSSLSWN